MRPSVFKRVVLIENHCSQLGKRSALFCFSIFRNGFFESRHYFLRIMESFAHMTKVVVVRLERLMKSSDKPHRTLRLLLGHVFFFCVARNIGEHSPAFIVFDGSPFAVFRRNQFQSGHASLFHCACQCGNIQKQAWCKNGVHLLKHKALAAFRGNEKRIIDAPLTEWFHYGHRSIKRELARDLTGPYDYFFSHWITL